MKIKRIAFRLDANERIGIGHLMRCLTIITELKKVGIESTLYVTSLIDMAVIGDAIHVVKMDVEPFSNEDADILGRYMDDNNESIVFIDSYDITETYIQRLNKYKRIIMADSYCDYDVEMVIQPNAFLSTETKSIYKKQVYLKGLEYQPIRDEFFENRARVMPDIKNILFLSGGTIPQKFCETVLDEVFKRNIAKQITIVLGNCVSETVYKELEYKYKSYHIKICKNVLNMSKIMCENDVIISACGSTVYEIMACGVPVIVYSMAENQRYVLEKLQKEAGILYAGDINDENTCENIISGLKELTSISARKKQIDSMRKQISCNGARNIVKKIIEYL